MIMKGLCNGAPFTVETISRRAGLEPGPLDQYTRLQTDIFLVVILGHLKQVMLLLQTE